MWVELFAELWDVHVLLDDIVRGYNGTKLPFKPRC